MNVEEVGEGFPVIVLHGGPGMDHTMFRPYLDPLGEDFRVVYVDERGQGRSDRVDPQTLSLDVFARDVDLLAEALELEHFALLGHSFGAIIATYHATELETAAAYVISGGGDTSDALMADVEKSFDAMGEARVLHEGIANSEFVLVPDAGHMSFVEQQGFYVDAVRRFLLGVAIKA